MKVLKYMNLSLLIAVLAGCNGCQVAAELEKVGIKPVLTQANEDNPRHVHQDSESGCTIWVQPPGGPPRSITIPGPCKPGINSAT
uniref:Uncharacterized protein n=1 Tax=Anopheles albimanus TaxID=7167 RepID=A0A182FWJ1_ANOAL